MLTQAESQWAAFTGHLDVNPDVTVVCYLSGLEEKAEQLVQAGWERIGGQPS